MVNLFISQNFPSLF